MRNQEYRSRPGFPSTKRTKPKTRIKTEDARFEFLANACMETEVAIRSVRQGHDRRHPGVLVRKKPQFKNYQNKSVKMSPQNGKRTRSIYKNTNGRNEVLLKASEVKETKIPAELHGANGQVLRRQERMGCDVCFLRYETSLKTG